VSEMPARKVWFLGDRSPTLKLHNPGPVKASIYCLTSELGNLGYDSERLGIERPRLAALVIEAHVEGMPTAEIARLGRMSRSAVETMIGEAA
jgi:hypothetical protein